VKRPSLPAAKKLKHLLALISTQYFRNTGFKEKMSLSVQSLLTVRSHNWIWVSTEIQVLLHKMKRAMVAHSS